MYEYLLTNKVKEFLYLHYPLKVALIREGKVEEFYSIYNEYINWCKNLTNTNKK